MVTKEEIMQLKSNEEIKTNSSFKVTANELSPFLEQEYQLAELIADRKKRYEKENNVKTTQAYYDIEEMCQISMDAYKKAMCRSRKITRTFLYKLVVGFKMSLEEANEYFELCGGPLNKKNVEDYVCIKAIEDKDSIQQLVDDFEKHLNLKIGYNYGK